MKYMAEAVVNIREIVRRKGEEVEQAVLAKLSPEAAQIYQTTMPTKKIPIEIAVQVYEAAASVLYPGNPWGKQELARLNARKDITGIYRIILQIVNTPMVIKKASQLWKLYHEKGQAFAEKSGEDKVIYFTVEDYPELPQTFREILCGYIQGLAELTGAKNIRVIHDNTDPNAWKWKITYE